jgi:hypothetical protein
VDQGLNNFPETKPISLRMIFLVGFEDEVPCNFLRHTGERHPEHARIMEQREGDGGLGDSRSRL